MKAIESQKKSVELDSLDARFYLALNYKDGVKESVQQDLEKCAFYLLKCYQIEGNENNVLKDLKIIIKKIEWKKEYHFVLFVFFLNWISYQKYYLKKKMIENTKECFTKKKERKWKIKLERWFGRYNRRGRKEKKNSFFK